MVSLQAAAPSQPAGAKFTSARPAAARPAASRPAETKPADTQPVATQPAGCRSVLRLARSADGLLFRDTGEVLLEDASGPALVRLPNGHLLALCDVVAEPAGGETVMVVSRSADDGRHWTPAQPIRVAELDARAIRARHGALAWMPDGSLRLYFVAGQTGTSRRGATASQPFEGLLILSAVTWDGLQYKLDRKMGLVLDAVADVHVMALADREGFHLFLDEGARAERAKAACPRLVEHLASRDGQKFQEVEPVCVRGLRFVGSVVSVDRRCRAYVSGDEGVRSLVAADTTRPSLATNAALRWTLEEGIRMAGGRDPAVVQLNDGTFLMLYCAPAAGDLSKKASAVASAPATQPEQIAGAAASGKSSGKTEVRARGAASETSGEAVVWETFAPEPAGAAPELAGKKEDKDSVKNPSAASAEQSPQGGGQESVEAVGGGPGGQGQGQGGPGASADSGAGGGQPIAAAVAGPGGAGTGQPVAAVIPGAGGSGSGVGDQEKSQNVKKSKQEEGQGAGVGGQGAGIGDQGSGVGGQGSGVGDREKSQNVKTSKQEGEQGAGGGGLENLRSESSEEAKGKADSGAAEGPSDESGQDSAAGSEDGSPPKPDFVNPVNYVEWLKQQNPGTVENNAFDAYDAFMPGQRNPSEDKPGWPDTINDMFNGEHTVPIGPWDPAQHPDWEATHQSIQGLLDQFREATRYERYACPLLGPGEEASPDGEQTVYSLLLPSLSAHRAMTKATMADSWRTENGQVQPERMLDAMETSLRNANHMEQASTLIHHLVGMAEQALVQTNARKALQHNVFTSPDQLETALDTLKQYDHYDATAATWLPMEHAAAMDAVQQMFTPATPDGQPQLNRERARRLITLSMKGGEPLNDAETASLNEKLDKLAAMSPEEVRKAADVVDSHFRELGEKWRTGYPQVRAGDISQLEAKTHETTALTELVFPSLNRAYHLTARNEANRRATQLSYEVHLFKARNGRWPQSLDELPQEAGNKSRIDPFTGSDFGYQMTEAGLKIYTTGEDGQDNGGVHSEQGDDGKDYVYWPLQK